jgi:hypothetical protein
VIPVQGSKDTGCLYSWSSQVKPTNKWEIDKLEIEVDSKGKWKFYERLRSDNENISLPDSDSGASENVDSEFFYLKSS